MNCGWEACEDASGVKGERRPGACTEGLNGVCKDAVLGVGADGRSKGVAAGCSESFGCEV